jgi:hypothetical protein
MNEITKRILILGILVAIGTIAVISVTQARAGFPIQAPVTTSDTMYTSDTVDESQPPPSSPRIPIEKIIYGPVVEVREGYITVNDSTRGLVTLHILPETRIWKGEWNSDLPIEVGDSLIGHGEPNEDGTVYEMAQMEINVASLRGAVLDVKKTSEGLDVQLREVYTGESFLIHITSETLAVSEEGNEVPFVEAQLDLRPGDGVQIVGLKLKDGTVVATLVF